MSAQAPRHLGTLLCRLRHAAGLTRRQLAAQAGLSDAAIRNLERGRCRPTRSQVSNIIAVPAIGGPLSWTALRALAAQEGIEVLLSPDPVRGPGDPGSAGTREPGRNGGGAGDEGGGNEDEPSRGSR